MTLPLMMFAAGFGTRMKEFTRHRPKPMIEVAGKHLVDHALDLAQDAGADPIVANLHYLPDPLIAHLTPKGVQTIVEAPDILETGGGLRNALPLLGGGPVVTLNTDAVWVGPNPIRLLNAAWDADKMDALLICVPPEQVVGHAGAGDFVMSPDSKLTRGPGMIYGGVQIIKTDLLAEIAHTAFSLNLLWDKMLDTQRLYGLRYPGSWCDVGHPGGILLAEQMLAADDV